MKPGLLHACLAGLVLAAASSAALAAGEPAPVLLAIDAEFGVNASTSAQAIQRGAEIAAGEINAAGGLFQGRPLKVVTRNNNAVPARAAENIRELAADPDVIAVMSGKHSPVVQQMVPLVEELRIPYLDPWAAADDITERLPLPGFVFRLSLKDSWALSAMVRTAAARGYRRIGLLLPNSSWGRSSLAAAERALGKGPQRLVDLQWHNFGEQDFAAHYSALRKSGAEALLLVANEMEGAALIREIARRPPAERLPIISHWGVTGGQFFSLTRKTLAGVDFSVVQSFSFLDARNTAPGSTAARVVKALQQNYGVVSARQIESPVGVAHAYDLTHLLALAVKRAGSLQREAIRDALEQLPEHRGLVRHYRPPFTPERHDALEPTLIFMARYAPDGAIQRIR